MDRARVLGWLLPALAAAASGGASEFHVSARGDDAGPGTRARPWRTLERASRERYRPGDRVLLRGGQSFAGGLLIDERSATAPDRPLVIGSYGGGRALIRAGRETAVLVRNLGGVEVRDLVLVGAGERSEGTGVAILNQRGRERLAHVVVEDVEVSAFRWAGIYVGGVPTDLPGHDAPAGSRFGFQQVRIARCRAHGNTYHGIHVSANWKATGRDYGNADVSIVDSVAHDNDGDPFYTENHSGSGIMLDDTDGGTIERCLAFRNGARNAGASGGPIGIWTHASRRVVIQHCESWANRTGGAADGGGFDLDGGVSESVVQYCYSHDNDGAGFLVWEWGAHHALAKNAIRWCISENDGRRHKYGGVHVGTGAAPVRDIDVYQNAVYVTAAPAGQPRGLWVGGGPSEGIRFRNNVVVVGNGVPLVEIEPALAADAVTLEGNAYWSLGAPFSVIDRGQSFATLAAWCAATGRERRDSRDVGLFADPRLSRAGEHETVADPRRLAGLQSYRLRAGSPLIGAGVDLRALGIDPGTRDFFGRRLPASGPPDVGAHQRRQ